MSLPVTVRAVQVEGEPDTVMGSLWARSQVDDLEERLRSGETAVAEQITTLGLEHRLVTRFTSFVAVDRSRRVGQGDPTTIVQPVETPEGVDGAAAGARPASPPPPGPPRPTVSSPAPPPMAEAAARPAPRGRRPAMRAREAAPDMAPRGGGGDMDSLLSGSLGAGRASGGGRAASMPTKTAGRADAPAPTRAVIQREMRRLRPALLRCYEEGLSRSTELQGRIVLRFQIAPDGRVLSPAVASATLQDAAVQQCVTRVVSRARFPSHGGGTPQVVSYPLIFSPDPSQPGRGRLR